jgi:hypothetical protein
MSTYTIVGGRPTIDKDPGATLDYLWDWSAWLAAVSDTISSVSVTSSGATVGTVSHAAGVVTARISGGTEGTTVPVACQITTTGARIDERTIYLRMVQR